MYNVAFFTEAGTKRGMGHLIRCYTVYETFKCKGLKCDFFLDSDVNFSYKFNDIQYFKWDELPSIDRYSLIFIDSYVAPLEVYEYIAKNVKKVIYIDDFNRLDYPKGIVVNFLPEANTMYNKKKYHSYLLGTDYLPIRTKLIEHKNDKKLNQIFIMMGGFDKDGISKKIIDAISNIKINKVIVTTNEDTYLILKKIKDINVLFQPTDEQLAISMASSSIAISTASMSLYELSFFSIPTIVVAVSKNQEIGAKQLINNNLAYQLVDINTLNWRDTLNKTLLELLNMPPFNLSVIDGKGTSRILEKSLEVASI